ncbi:MAG: TIGR03751 family conjugal transfer lipoprotein [Rhodobacteraceae bacterium]|nr:TIGR03751 family conjugal transfer lipoprotein [Paracoccaceae bacterium]
MHAKRFTLAAIVSISLSGCATGGKDTILPQTGPTMKEVYDAHFSRGRRFDAPRGVPYPDRRPLDEGPMDRPGYAFEARMELGAVFPKLPNPELVMYVYPHLAGPGYPVPGYATGFTLYEKTEYALPGEVAP